MGRNSRAFCCLLSLCNVHFECESVRLLELHEKCSLKLELNSHAQSSQLMSRLLLQRASVSQLCLLLGRWGNEGVRDSNSIERFKYTSSSCSSTNSVLREEYWEKDTFVGIELECKHQARRESNRLEKNQFERRCFGVIYSL